MGEQSQSSHLLLLKEIKLFQSAVLLVHGGFEDFLITTRALKACKQTNKQSVRVNSVSHVTTPGGNNRPCDCKFLSAGAVQ